MAISEGFKNAIASGDLADIRLSMCNELLIDPTFRNFAEMEKLVAAVPNLYGNLYVAYNNIPMETDSSHWNDAYLGLQKVKLIGNFCPERIEHVKAVVLKLHPPKPAKAQGSVRTESSSQRPSGGSNWSSGSSRPSTPGYEEEKSMDARNGRLVKIVGCGAGGAILGAVVGSKVGGVLGALVGCGVGYLISKR